MCCTAAKYYGKLRDHRILQYYVNCFRSHKSNFCR